MEKVYDVIVLGGGPAGISAGIYALRAGISVLIIDFGKSSLENAKIIENYYGVEPISGKDLKEKGINQFVGLGGNINKELVVSVRQDFANDLFIVKTNINQYIAKSIIICTGVVKQKNISGLDKYQGKNVSYCAVCDGFFYRGKTVAVIGDKEFALSECEELSKLAKEVILLTNGKKNLNYNIKNVKTVSEEIDGFIGEDFISSVVLKNGQSINVDGVFVALGTLSSFEMAKQLGLMVNDNFIEVDKNYMTNVAGIFAAGDVIGGLLQVAKAVSDGAHAGLAVVKYLRNKG